MDVSIIVPLYKGKEFLKSILNQIEQCALAAPLIKIELILFNDYPDEFIEVDKTGLDFEVCVVNNDCNRGIHGARVEALKYSTGKYVVFLDQDDRVEPAYIFSQMKKIGDDDAVVCRVIHNKKCHYTKSYKFEEVVSKEFMFKKWCPIVSPGQVVIKKASIPDVWKNNILHNNGADDYFLWLLMAGTGKKFALNQEILFEHIVNGNNTSLNTNLMMDSEDEMIEILLKSHVFSEEDEKQLEKLRQSLRRTHITQLDNYRIMYDIMNLWLNSIQEGKNPALFFEKSCIKKIAIYGAGDIGKIIFKLLKMLDVGVQFYIDQNAEYIIQKEVPVYTLEEAPLTVDAVVVAIAGNVNSIEEQIKAKYKILVYQISALMDILNR